MKAEDIIQEILLQLVDIVIQGSKPKKIIVSEKVHDLLMNITLMPRSLQYIDSVFYIADVPVEKADIQYKNAEIWYRIECGA